MNIHREPSADDPNRSRINLGLRRRIWWTAFVSTRSLLGFCLLYLAAMALLKAYF